MAAPCVLLLSPGILRWTDVDFGLPHLVALGGYLRQTTGVRVEILDMQYEAGDHNSLAHTLEGLGPHLLIGLSCYSSFDYPRVMALARFLRARFPGVPLVTGGYHASALPTDMVFPGSPFDAVVQGEGELPLRRLVETLLGGGRVQSAILPHENIEEPDALPPYAWDLLDRYWPRAHTLGRKLQIYLSRGCPYRCVFCMERAKTDYRWRAFSPERALEELRRLARHTDLRHWIVNIGDPLFGFHRAWRQEVLEGIVREGLLPRQYWTLTRSDDLDADDVALFARARFSIGIGLESGSPTMLRTMRKGNTPERYLEAIRRLASLSRIHGLNWAANIILGHPGETPETMRETHRFLSELVRSAPETCGWLSIDPFRLYPGAWVYQEREAVRRQHGTRFHHERWWTSWYDGPFRAEHLDPSAALSFEERVAFQYEAYPPLIDEVQRRFRGQGTPVDAIFRASMEEQVELLGPDRRDALLRRAREVRPPTETLVPVPIGLQLSDPRVRRREEAVRRLLDQGVLRTERLIEALLRTEPEQHMPEAVAAAMFADQGHVPLVEGELPFCLPFRSLALGLEALAPAPGDRAASLGTRGGYVAALLQALVGGGEVVSLGPPWPAGPFDRIVCGAALPAWPAALREALVPGGRALAVLGPRFRHQDLVLLTDEGERTLGRLRVGVLGGQDGWVPAPRAAGDAIALAWREAPALAYAVLARVDLGNDAASLHDPALPPAPWAAALAQAYATAPRRLLLQTLPLGCRTREALLERLPRALRDPADQALATTFSEALQAVRAVTEAEGSGHEARAAIVRATVLEPLQALRERLYTRSSATPPELLLLDCPALGRHGRAATVEGVRVVAVSFAEPPEHLLMQVLHEEMHVVTDPIVRREAPRDTRPASPHFATHRALEDVAVAATEAMLAAHAPTQLPAFSRWRARSYGLDTSKASTAGGSAT